jgi:hypothetical protein
LPHAQPELELSLQDTEKRLKASRERALAPAATAVQTIEGRTRQGCNSRHRQHHPRKPFTSTNTDDDFDGADAICKIVHDNRQRDNPSDGCSSMKSLANCYTVQQTMNLIPDAPNKQPR